MASIRYTGQGRARALPMHLLIGGLSVLLVIQDHHAAVATIPTIDNIVKILQSPVVQQLILPRPLVAADPSISSVAADEPPAMSSEMMKASTKPSQMNDEGASKSPSNDPVDRKRGYDDTIRSFVIPRTRSLPGCPLCDASVYSYCDDKVYHDACCCGSINGAAPFGGGGFGGGGFGGGFGRQGFGGPGYGGNCGYQGCSYLYANSCYEHQLIVNCCCNSPY